MAGRSLDPWLDRYATRTRGLAASEIRALFSVASRPEVVSLAGGMPYTSALPLEGLADLMGSLMRERGAAALQYSSGQGDPVLREHIVEVMALEGIDASPEDVVVTVGSQQALDLVTRVFCDPGDVVLAEAPSYVGALGTFRAYQAEVVHVPMDDDGLVPAALREALTAVARTGRRVKFLYTIPNFHNPAGTSLAEERRDEVLEICRAAEVLVLEDNPYGLLGFDGPPRRALRAREDDGVVYLGSFSKTISPGLRVGWALAPPAVREKLVLASEAAVLCPPTFNQLAIVDYLGNHDWRKQVEVFRDLYRERRDAMLRALEDLFPATASWTHPGGGFYVWVTLPPGVDSRGMLPRAVNERVAYVPGTAFFADGTGQRYARLSYCYPEPERIREGVRRLATVLEQELDLHATFGTGNDAPAPGRRDGDPVTQSPAPDLR